MSRLQQPASSEFAQQPFDMHRFESMYERFDDAFIRNMPALYAEDIEFIDPIGQHKGLRQCQQYFARLNANLTNCRFTFLNSIADEGEAFIKWDMLIEHPSLAKGQPVNVRGMTHIKYHSKIYYHEDSYDLGAMLYEHVPILQSIIAWIKRRLQQS